MSASQTTVDFFKLSSDILSKVELKDLKTLVSNLCVKEGDRSHAVKETIDKSFTDETILHTEGKETKSFVLGETTFARRTFSIDIPTFSQFNKIYSFAFFDDKKSITSAREITSKANNMPTCYCFHNKAYLKGKSYPRTGKFRILLCFVDESQSLEWFLTKDTFEVTSERKPDKPPNKRKGPETIGKRKKNKPNQDEMEEDSVSLATESNPPQILQEEEPIHLVQEEPEEAQQASSIGLLPTISAPSNQFIPQFLPPIPEDLHKQIFFSFTEYFNQLIVENTALKIENGQLRQNVETLQEQVAQLQRKQQGNEEEFVNEVLNISQTVDTTNNIGCGDEEDVFLTVEEAFNAKPTNDNKEAQAMETVAISCPYPPVSDITHKNLNELDINESEYEELFKEVQPFSLPTLFEKL